MNAPGSARVETEIHGWLAINKPAGLTSFEAVSRIKPALRIRKAGHAGTLDKPASGVLVIAFGKATKTLPFITDSIKCYRFVVNFGAATSTDDATGTIIARSENRPSKEEVLAALDLFQGLIQQVPPQFSSVKVDGIRAYSKALKGERVQLKSRPLLIKSLQVTEWNLPGQITLEMECGKGGYVRSVARDLGDKLGCYGHVETLVRTRSGPFSLDQAHPLEHFTGSTSYNNLRLLVLPLETALRHMPEYGCSKTQAGTVQNGGSIEVSLPGLARNQTIWVSLEGQAVAWGIAKDGRFFPKKVLMETSQAV